MASNFQPPSGSIRFIRSYDDVKKIFVSQNPRAMPYGSLLWLNKVSGRYQAECASESPTNATTDSNASNSSASTYTTLALANAAFAPLFLGVSAAQRIPQQLNSFGNFNVGGQPTGSPMDASTPFIPYYDTGIFAIPVGPTLSSTGVLTSAVEPWTLVQADGFANLSTSGNGYTDPAGKYQSDTDYYLYSNCCTTTATAANAFGYVIERAEIGSPVLIVQLKSHIAQVQLGGAS